MTSKSRMVNRDKRHPLRAVKRQISKLSRTIRINNRLRMPKIRALIIRTLPRNRIRKRPLKVYSKIPIKYKMSKLQMKLMSQMILNKILKQINYVLTRFGCSYSRVNLRFSKRRWL